MKLSQLLNLHTQENPQLSPRTVEKYQSVIRNFTNDTGINSIFFSHQNCIDWYNKIYNRVSPTTCNNYCIHLKALFNTAVKLGHLNENIFASMPILKNININVKTLDKGAIVDLISMISSDSYYSNVDWFYLAMVDVFRLTAIRRRQLIGIKWRDVDFKNQTLYLNSEFSKNRIENLIPLNKVLIGHFQTIKQKAHKPKSSDQVFNITEFVGTYKSNVMTEDHVSRLFTKWSRKIGVKISPHRFRHTTATKLANNGCNLKALQKLLG
ncbi:tyrosine-type recombinase/integrase, partial [Bathymodiolus heckerae thiotrophic gill symbiont]|uniref:tyrosine-type recombinase/integrase n=1 Tax=Bathymodiolus heckerae thiotrophic gill symbiont TaxID=1052212 RepID=UPI0010FD7FA2